MLSYFFKRSFMAHVRLIALILLVLGFACSEKSDEQTEETATQERSPVTLQKTKLVYYAIPG
ncbi:hypothetical protein GWN42_00105 [candidate division KSB1 bacterium]|nr:hypothetical protein [candidate division KSB1 bacterium]